MKSEIKGDGQGDVRNNGSAGPEGLAIKPVLGITALIAAVTAAVVIPARSLFWGEGFYADFVRYAETTSMMTEILFWFVLLSACFFLTHGFRAKVITTVAIVTAFCWLHVTFLPMAVSGLYLGYLLLAGRFFWGKFAKAPVRFGILADFLVGGGLVITQFCVMSALSLGSIPALKLVSAAEAVFLYARAAVLFIRKSKKQDGFPGWAKMREGWETWESTADRRRFIWAVLPALLITMFLIQIGRMNISLDFDTLWYGVRSEYILDNGKGIYENPGLVGMVYVYSKGLEVLTLPLCDLASHAYLQFFNVWLAGLGLAAVYGCAAFFMKGKNAFLAVILAGAVPGIMNMSISAKPDIVTWLLQLIMVFYLLCFVQNGKKTGIGDTVRSKADALPLILAFSAYLLSLTMKPTSLVFSTAVFGMAGVYLIASRRLSLAAPLGCWFCLFPSAAALVGIWARTMIITGMPVTSVFTSIFARLGFQMKYPFATGSLPQNWQDESNLHVLLRRLYQMLLAPEGKDMGHVVIAWGTSLMFFILSCLLVFWIFGKKAERGKKRREATGTDSGITVFTHTVFWPFLAVNLVSLVMLYQVDGNYFMLLYTAAALFFCSAFEKAEHALKKAASWLLAPLLAFNILVAAVSNWAWSLGFSQIELLNKGRVNHEALQQESLVEKGNAQIWQILEEDPETRVIAFGDHPFCLAFPCLVQSYKDITAPWGNVELVNTAPAFEQYMAYAKADYVYVEAGYIGENSWSWSYGLLKEMIARGAVTDLFFENGNVLARVNVGPFSEDQTEKTAEDGAAGPEPLAAEAAGIREREENLRLFNENYRPAQ